MTNGPMAEKPTDKKQKGSSPPVHWWGKTRRRWGAEKDDAFRCFSLVLCRLREFAIFDGGSRKSAETILFSSSSSPGSRCIYDFTSYWRL